MKPIDLYLKDLVPLAQTLMLLGELYGQLTRHSMKLARKRTLANGTRLDRAEVRAQFLGEGFNTLNLVNCEVQSWTSAVTDQDTRVLLLSTALQPLKNRIQQEFDSWARMSGVTADALVKAGLIRAQLRPKKDFSGERIVDSLVVQLNTWGPAHVEVLSALGYEHASRGAWLAARTRRNTPLMRDGRIGVWRTLANNSDWTLTLAQLGVTIAGYGNPRRFGSDVGKARLPELMRIAFEAQPQPMVAEPSDPAEAPLPNNVDVRRTPQGYLAVTAKHPRLTQGPAGKASPELTKFLQATTEFAALLKAREQEFVCGPRRLPDAVDKAAAWLREQEELEFRAREAFELFRQDQVRRQVMARLGEFSKEELAILAEHFQRPPADADDDN